MIEKAFEFLVDFFLGPALDGQWRNPRTEPLAELVEPTGKIESKAIKLTCGNKVVVTFDNAIDQDTRHQK